MTASINLVRFPAERLTAPDADTYLQHTFNNGKAFINMLQYMGLTEAKAENARQVFLEMMCNAVYTCENLRLDRIAFRAELTFLFVIDTPEAVTLSMQNAASDYDATRAFQKCADVLALPQEERLRRLSHHLHSNSQHSGLLVMAAHADILNIGIREHPPGLDPRLRLVTTKNLFYKQQRLHS